MMPRNVPYLDRIWRVESFIEIEENLSADEAFKRMEPLFQTQGTTLERQDNTLVYSKKNPNAQDKLATFTAGTLRHEQAGGITRLSYDVTSTALFLCFLAPFFFLAFAGLTLVVNELEAPFVAAQKAEEEKKKAEEGEEEEEKIELHWIDQMLGAPEPEQPGEEDEEEKSEDRKKRGEEDEEEIEGNHSPTRSLYLAGIFFLIYCVGRVLEPYLLKRTFRRALTTRSEIAEAELGVET